MRDPICVVLACDENYAMHVAAAVASAAGAPGRHQGLDVHVLSTGLTSDVRARLERLETLLPRLRIAVHDMSIEKFSSWRRSEHISQAAYLRLQMCDLVPDHYDRVLYLDADAICLEPLDELWSLPLGDASLAAARDTSTPFVSSPRGIAKFAEIGLDRTAPYFNSGVLLVDTKKWRSASPLDFAAEYVDRFGAVQRALDQEILNACFAGEWSELHTRWNASPRLFNIHVWQDEDARRIFLPTAVDARTNPSIVHFLGPKKPWHFRSQTPWKELYFEALATSQWFDSRRSFMLWRVREVLAWAGRKGWMARRHLRRLRR